MVKTCQSGRLEVAAAGGHNVLMSGPPGSGKTLLARSMPSTLRRPAHDPHRGAGRHAHLLGRRHVARRRPADPPPALPAPHHTISHAGLVGGGQWPRPGEISLAHRGVLFLDEMPEFGQHGLEVLRQPLEDRTVTISRAVSASGGSLTFPANCARRRPKPMPLRLLGRPGTRLLGQPQEGVRHQPLPERLSGPCWTPCQHRRCWHRRRHPCRGAARPVPEALVDRIDNERRGEPSAADVGGDDPGPRRGGAGAAIGAIHRRR